MQQLIRSSCSFARRIPKKQEEGVFCILLWYGFGKNELPNNGFYLALLFPVPQFLQFYVNHAYGLYWASMVRYFKQKCSIGNSMGTSYFEPRICKIFNWTEETFFTKLVTINLALRYLKPSSITVKSFVPRAIAYQIFLCICTETI